MEESELKKRIKEMMVENLMLKISPAEIGDDQRLFGPNSLGLDSVDALQLVVALDFLYQSARGYTRLFPDLDAGGRPALYPFPAARPL